MRCDDFYAKWKRCGNFCEKNPSTAARIEAYLTACIIITYFYASSQDTLTDFKMVKKRMSVSLIPNAVVTYHTVRRIRIHDVLCQFLIGIGGAISMCEYFTGISFASLICVCLQWGGFAVHSLLIVASTLKPFDDNKNHWFCKTIYRMRVNIERDDSKINISDYSAGRLDHRQRY